MSGMTFPAVVGGMTESFIWTNVCSRFSLSVAMALASVAVVCPPLTIWRSVTFVSRSPVGVLVTSAADAVLAMPLLYAKNIVGSVVTVFLMALLTRGLVPR